MTLARYVSELLERASQRSIVLTDRLTVLLVPFATFILWIFGLKLTPSIQETLFLVVAITVVFVVVFRFLAASFLLWRDDQEEKARLHNLLERPFQREREAASAYVATLRTDLSDSLARLVSIAEIYQFGGVRNSIFGGELPKQYADAFRRSRELINALSYDVPIRVSAFKLTSLVAEIVSEATAGRAVAALMNRLQEMKKPTFRLIHKRDDGELGEFLTMLEVQNLSGKSEGDSDPADEFSDDPKDRLAWLKQQIRDPELLEGLRRHLQTEASRR